ncbi:MAG: hypothetical protein WDM79_04715 [Terricaulis sp.]
MSARPLLLALVLAACATSAASDVVPAALRGCWIERRGEDTVTMRWFPESGLAWRGDQLFYAPGQEPERQGYRIEATAGENEQFGWALCPQAEPTNPPCRALFFKDGGDVDYRFEIRASAEHLRLTMFDEGQETVLFDGARDGCD